jgi:hypothetical protein
MGRKLNFKPYLINRWSRNKKLRAKARRLDISPTERQDIPPHLRAPEKSYGFLRVGGLRGPAVVQWLMLMDGFYPHRRCYLECINAMHEDGVINSKHEFISEGPLVDRERECLLAKRLEEVQALVTMKRYSQWQACTEVAANWALGKSLEAGTRQLYKLICAQNGNSR